MRRIMPLVVAEKMITVIQKQKMWLVAPVLYLVSLAAYGGEALVDGYHLKPASAVVKVGGTVKLDLVHCEVVDKNPGKKPNAKSDSKPMIESKLVCEGDEGYNDELAQLAVPDNVQWKVDGPGRVSGDNEGATYHAPASKPKPNQATVAVTFKYPLMHVGGKSYPKAKQTLLSRIKILDDVKTYTGTFSLHDVTVNSEYTRDLAGKIKWDFEEYYDIGGWREYTGVGTAALSIKRVWCGAASFSGVPVEGWLKVHDDKTYEFQINLVGDNELTRTCRRDDFTWKEEYSPSGDGMASGDPCGRSELYERYTDITDLTFGRNASCDQNLNQIQEGWSFKAVE